MGRADGSPGEEAGGARPRKKAGPGRPKVVEGSVLPYTLYLTRELISQVDAVSGDRSRSGWVRDAIEEKLTRGAEAGRGESEGGELGS